MKRFFILLMAVTVIGLSASKAADPPDILPDIGIVIEHSQTVTASAIMAPGTLKAEAYPLQQIEAVYQGTPQPPGNVSAVVKETAYTDAPPNRDHWPCGYSKASRCESGLSFFNYSFFNLIDLTSYLPGYSMARTCGKKLEVFKNTKAQPGTVTASYG